MSDAITSLSNSTAISTDTTASASDDLGQDEFLNLLVAQLQNQDPLNPAEGTEFTAQLAQFSSLEQLTNLNTTATSLLDSSANSDNLALLNTIGNEVLYYGENFEYSDGPIDMGYVLGDDATSATMEISLDGQLIRSITLDELDSGIHNIQWDGLDDYGDQAPGGDYTIEVSALDAASVVISSVPLLKAEVTGVNLQSTTGANLTTTLGDIASYSDIVGIYTDDE